MEQVVEHYGGLQFQMHDHDVHDIIIVVTAVAR
jgi:hypothetical protein